MKHSDFLRSLKALKRNLIYTQKKHHFSNTVKDEKKEKLYCTCKDSTGESKYLYTSQKELEYILSSRSTTLRSYPCPYEKGWHLTKVK